MTINITITLPTQWNASTRTWASKHRWVTNSFSTMITFIWFISAIGTFIALPRRWNTNSIITSKIILFTFNSWWIFTVNFIRVIWTVRFTCTNILISKLNKNLNKMNEKRFYEMIRHFEWEKKLLPSHRQAIFMHWVLRHWNLSSEQVTFGHPISSLLSKQSNSPSHRLEMQTNSSHFFISRALYYLFICFKMSLLIKHLPWIHVACRCICTFNHNTRYLFTSFIFIWAI